MYGIELSREAVKFLKKASREDLERLQAGIDDIGAEPFWGRNIRKLVGDFEGFYRYRVGKIRIIYSIDTHSKTVYIATIGKRGDVY